MNALMLRRRAMMNEQGGGGGGGGASEVLLASGDYMLASNLEKTKMTIPVQVTGSISRVVVVKDSVTSGVGQTTAWYRDYSAPQSATDAFTRITELKYVNSSGTAAYAARSAITEPSIYVDATTNPTTISCERYSNNYYIKADTYHWYIYGTN